MKRTASERRHRRWAIYAGIAAVAWVVLQVDDWGRDFVEHRAEIAVGAPEALQPLVSERPVGQLADAVRWAASRIGSWEWVGTTGDESGRSLVFVRTHRLLRLSDDIVVRIEDAGSERIVTATSISRLGVGDLGGNPHNLRRLLTELRDVLDGAAAEPAPEPERT